MIFIEMNEPWKPGEDTAKDSISGVEQLKREMRRQKKLLADMQKRVDKLCCDLDGAIKETERLKGLLQWPGGSPESKT